MKVRLIQAVDRDEEVPRLQSAYARRSKPACCKDCRNSPGKSIPGMCL